MLVRNKPQAETQQPEQFNEQAFEADYYLKESESNVAKSYPKYSEDKEQLLQKFSANGGNEQTFTFLSTIASQANIDIAIHSIEIGMSSLSSNKKHLTEQRKQFIQKLSQELSLLSN